jgi:predicted permease
MNDLRYAFRQLRKSPGLTATIVATLAIGIGATTAIFSAVDAVLLRPQPYPEAERLVALFERVPSGGRNSISGGSFKDWREHQTQFSALTIYANDRLDLTGRGDPEKIEALSVSAGFTQVLGIQPLLGRGFLPEDEAVGGQNKVVLLTENFWRERFGAAPTVLGESLQLDGQAYAIVGVLPNGAWGQQRVSIFIPYVLQPNSYLTSHDVHRSRGMGRLRPGATLATAEAELNAIKQRVDATYPAFKKTWGVTLQPLQQFMGEDSKPTLLLLLGAVALVLLIACANVANLLLARASTRQREIAVRAALGASGARIVRQVFTESVLLALLGGAAGVLLATWSIDLLGPLSARLLPATMAPQLDARVLAFSIFAACGTGVLFGLFPAWRSRRPDLTRALKSGTAGATDGARIRSQSMLVVAEVALTAILLVGTGLLLRSLARTVTADPGYRAENVLMFDLTPPFNSQYRSEAQRMTFLERATEEIRTLPGVAAVATTDNLPFGSSSQGYFYSLEEKPETRQDRAGRVKYVSPDYFKALGARLVRGRAIEPADNRANAPRVVVVNEALVKVLFGAENPLGRRIAMASQIWEIVGVAADMRLERMHLPPEPTLFVPHWHFPWGSAFVVRTTTEPLAAARGVAAAIHRIDAQIPLANVHTLEHAMQEALGPQKLVLNLIGVFAGIALLLACIGIYGVMSYAVASRQRELSIRVALGALRADIMQLIVGRGARLTFLGLTLGLLGSFAAGRMLASRLPGIEAGDPLAFLGATLLLALVALLACWLPARRAARADPIAALRAE